MPWQEVSVMESRSEFVRLADQAELSFSQLCARFGISRKTGYKWLARAQSGEPLSDRSRRPHASPQRTPDDVEAAVLTLREQHPSWGGRKLRQRMANLGASPPAASTITAILTRHGCIDPAEAARHRAFQRFEHPHPNALWQMDFKGHFPMASARCHPLTVLDDHSRYALCLSACALETAATVRERLVWTFRRYGLPDRINMDNGAPWGAPSAGVERPLTSLTVWLRRLGVRCSHSRPYHPQTNGKDERFHRTLKRDVLHGQAYADLPACQRAFDRFREIYNAQRPHEALGLEVPAARYRPSERGYPETLPAVEYDDRDEVRRVQSNGWMHFRGYEVRVPKALAGQPVALRPTDTDGVWAVIFIAEQVATIDLRGRAKAWKPVTHVSEHL